ncbi:MAG: phosphatase PAP2 family protein [Chloroflexi bacterium]|nr:phosphatase PAP2 family protein [Anaerolineaceae bacterium]NMB89897.1 phosphatase PAP2 family protein [Chloroflexota bacterium]
MTYLRPLLELDDRLSHRLRLPPGQRWLWPLAGFFAHSGDSWFWLAGLGLVWLFGGSAWHDRSAVMAIGVFGLAVLVLAIKFTVRRQRPPGEWGAIYRSADPHSFPSGHAARSVMLATLAWQLGPPWFGWLLLAWAPLVCLARVLVGVHYLSDILAGVVVGFLAALLLLASMPLWTALVPFLF